MHYYIDGYNLLFRLSSRHEEQLAEQRQQWITDLNEKATLLNLSISIVFDAQMQLNEGSRSYYHHIEVLFSSPGQTADQLILSLLKRHPKDITVVTSDLRLAMLARHSSAKTESVEQFIQWLNRRYKLRVKKTDSKSKPSPTRERKAALLTPPVVLEKEQKKKKPSASSTPQECQDYYLEQFQTDYDLKKIERDKVKATQRAAKGQPVRRKKQTKKRTEDHLDDHARWLKLFQERAQDDGEQ